MQAPMHPDAVFSKTVNDLFENVCKHLEPYDSYSKRMTEGQKMVILIWALSGEAANGGIQQYLLNSSGDMATETIEYLRILGAEKQVAAFERIKNEVFGGEIPKDRQRRSHLLFEFEGDDGTKSDVELEQAQEKSETFFKDVDKAFGWCEDIRALAGTYIQRNPNQFPKIKQS